MVAHAVVDMGADVAIVYTVGAIAKDNTELVFVMTFGEGIIWRGLATVCLWLSSAVQLKK